MADYEHRWRDDQDRWRRDDEWHQQTAHGRHRPDYGSTGYGAYGDYGGGRRGEEHGPNYETGYTEPRGGWYGGGGRGQGGYGQGGHGYRGGRSDRGGYGASGGYEGQGRLGWAGDYYRGEIGRGYRSPDRDYSYGYGPEGWSRRGHEEGRYGRYGHGEEDRGFFARAGDEVASWFGDEDAERRRRMDALRGDESAAHHRGRGPRGYTRSDDRIREDVSDRLTDDPYLDASDIEVSVKGCEVTLSGTVNVRADKRRAEDLADDVSGVRHVQNNLRVQGAAMTTESAESASTRATTRGTTGSTGAL